MTIDSVSFSDDTIYVIHDKDKQSTLKYVRPEGLTDDEVSLIVWGIAYAFLENAGVPLPIINKENYIVGHQVQEIEEF